MCCRADTNINALRLCRHALIFRDLLSNNVLISDNSRVRKNFFLNKNRNCIKTIFFGIRAFFEISVLEILRIDCVYIGIEEERDYNCQEGKHACREK